MIFAARGDLAGARAAAHARAAQVEPAAFVAYVASYYDLFWLLDDSQRALLYQLKPADFDDDRGSWGLALAGAYALQGEGSASPGLRRLRAGGVRGPDPGHARQCAAPRAAERRAGLPRAQGRRDPRGPPGRRAGPDLPERVQRALPAAPARPDLHPGGRAGAGDRAARGRCSRFPTISRPGGSGSIRRSTRCGRIRGSRSWRREHDELLDRALSWNAPAAARPGGLDRRRCWPPPPPALWRKRTSRRSSRSSRRRTPAWPRSSPTRWATWSSPPSARAASASAAPAGRAGCTRAASHRQIDAHPGELRLPVRRPGVQRDRILPDDQALENFKLGHLKFDAQASAIALTARASADLAYRNGVAIVTMAKGGLMYEASVGGQKFSFKPVGK